MSAYKNIFVDNLKIFNEEEFQTFIEKVEINKFDIEFKYEIFLKIIYFEKPEIQELIKLYEFNDDVLKFQIDLKYLLNSEDIFFLINEYIRIKGIIIPDYKIYFFPNCIKFVYPEIIFLCKEKKWKTCFEGIINVIKKFISFVFSNKKIYLINEENYSKKTDHRFINGSFFVFDVEERVNYNKQFKSVLIAVTDFKKEYLLTPNKSSLDFDSVVSDIKKNNWYEMAFTLDKSENKKSKSDAWLTSYKKIETPKEHLKGDSAAEKINCLCTHTKFSVQDGLFNYEDFALKAKIFGHKALACTDFASVQSFSHVEEIAKKIGIKPIYGCELEIIPRFVPIIFNYENFVQSHTICVLDIETTGFHPMFDDLTEIAITKLSNTNIEIDKYYSLVKTNQKIRDEIVKLTRIDNKRLEEHGRELKTVLKEIKEFIGDSVLVIHNGIEFDLPFLNAQYKKCGLEIIRNPVLDTMLLSKGLYYANRYKSHALTAIAKRFGILVEKDNYHSADYDTRILVDVWKNLESELHARNIDTKNNFLEINKIDEKGVKKNYFGENVLLFAKNQKGIKAIYKLISDAHTKYFFEKTSIQYEEIQKYREDIFVVSSPVNSAFLNTILKFDDEAFKKYSNFYDYVIVPPVNHFDHEISREHISRENVEKILKVCLEWSKKFNLKAIINYAAKILGPENIEQYKVLVHAKFIGGKRHYLHSYKFITESLPDYSLKATQDLVKDFEFLKNQIDKDYWYEVFYKNQQELINQISDEIKIVNKKLHSPKMENVIEQMKEISYKNLKNKYGENLNKYLVDKVEKELNAIIANGYEVVYWVSHLLVKKSIEDGYLVGSRGSVGSSFVAHLLNVSEVNPLEPHYFCKECSHFEIVDKYLESGFDLEKKKCSTCKKYMKSDGLNIPFETFLGLNANKVPDIDLNFSGEYQLKAHNFLCEMFGKENTFRSGTISTIAKKTAFALTLNYLEDNEIPYNQGKIHWLSRQITDVKRTSGQHPGGILVVPKEYSVYDFTPINYPANDLSSEWLTTHFEFNDLHETFFKFDILGHDDPTFLANLYKLTNVDPRTISCDDKKILNLFRDINVLNISSNDVMGEIVGAIGLPEFGTLLTRSILKKCSVRSYADLVRISGISHGTNVWKHNIDKLVNEKNLALSNVITCRDDIMIYLNNLGIDNVDSFNIMESVRKGKGVPEDYLPLLKEKNVPDWYVESANKISYIFPKAHAAAYVLMCWRIAYYKIYHPVEFYATYFTIYCDYFDAKLLMSNNKKVIEERYLAIKKEIKSFEKWKNTNAKSKTLLTVFEVAIEMLARGIKFEKIDINKSCATRFVPNKEEKTILIPFISLDGMGRIISQQIEENRTENGNYKDREDIEKRTKINVTVLKKMEELEIIPEKKHSQQLRIEDFL